MNTVKRLVYEIKMHFDAKPLSRRPIVALSGSRLSSFPLDVPSISSRNRQTNIHPRAVLDRNRPSRLYPRPVSGGNGSQEREHQRAFVEGGIGGR